MNRWRCWSLVVCSLVTACGSKANPAFSCSDTPCTDPNYPYCDIDGSVGGIPEACTAVTCTAGAFQSCRSDSIALMCNNSGTSFDEVECAHGCDAATGCKLCEASQTVCQNGEVATCDASGAQTSTMNCPLGCFEDQPRCRDIDPSNGLGSYLGAVANPPDVDLSSGGLTYTVYADTGEIHDSNQNVISVPTFVAIQPGNAPPIRVFVANRLRLGHVEVRIKMAVALPQMNPAIAFLASSDITVEGNLVVFAGVGSPWFSECVGGNGTFDISQPPYSQSASGGGGFATVGAKGGTGGFVAGLGGGLSGNDTLIPLRGGCGSGGHNDNNSSNTFDGTPGGGALQLVSRTKVEINANAHADVSGFQGNWDPHLGADGGGAGGALLIEAPMVLLDDSSKLIATGGNGADGDGGGCVGAGSTCGLGGAGATPLAPAMIGQPGSVAGGGGGGGLGRIRINTADGTYMMTNTTQQLGSLTIGKIATR